MTQPVSGTTSFTGTSVSARVDSTTDSASLTNVLGWDFLMQETSNNSSLYDSLSSAAFGSSPSWQIGAFAYSNNLSYLSVKSDDSSPFKLNSVLLSISGYDNTTAGGPIQIVGYLHGVAVSGAVYQVTLPDIYSSSPPSLPTTVNLSGLAAFSDIDSFRLFAPTGHTVVDLAVGDINITLGATLAASAGSVNFIAASNGAPLTIDSGLTLTDPLSPTASSATVSITSNLHAAEDVLAFTNTSSATFGDITGSYDANTGVLTLISASSTASLAQFQAALRAVTYRDTAATPNIATRTISFTVNDGTTTSLAVSRAVTLTVPPPPPVPPVNMTPIVTAAPRTITVLANTAPTSLASVSSVVDLDNTTLASGTVSIGAGFRPGDALAFSNTSSTTYGNIAATYNAMTGVLTLSSAGAQATLAQWQAALGAVTFSSTSTATAARTILFAVNDGNTTSAAASTTVNVLGSTQAGNAVTITSPITIPTSVTAAGVPVVIGTSSTNPVAVAITGGATVKTGALTIQPGSTLTVDSTSALNASSITVGGALTLPTLSSATPITFSAGGSVTANTVSGAASVTGFGFGDSLHLSGVAGASGVANSLGTLAIGTATGVNAYLSSDGTGGTIVTPVSQTTATYRFFDPTSGIQFYTASADEAKQLMQSQSGYVFEGAGTSMVSLVTGNGDPNATAVYRFFDTRNGSHFYTDSTAERDQLIAGQSNLVYEAGSTFYEHATQQTGDVPVYRFFDTTHGTHFFTDNAAERANVLATRPDLTAEGIAFYEAPHTS